MGKVQGATSSYSTNSGKKEKFAKENEMKTKI